jgi:serine/threonine protein kinase
MAANNHAGDFIRAVENQRNQDAKKLIRFLTPGSLLQGLEIANEQDNQDLVIDILTALDHPENQSLSNSSFSRDEDEASGESSSTQPMPTVCRMADSEFDKYAIDLSQPIGVGGFGKVYRATYNKSVDVAVKITQKGQLQEKDFNNLKRECEILSQLHHPNIVALYGGHEDALNFYWFMELLTGGEVFELFTKPEHQSRVGIREARHFFVQMVEAVRFCHHHNVVHRDIKLENVLLRRPLERIEEAEICLVDFGLATFQREPGAPLYDMVGSPYTIAPEILEAKPYSGRRADVWSLGVCLAIMANRYSPFWGDSLVEIFDQIKFKEPRIRPDLSLNLTELIKMMLIKDPYKRPTIDEVSIHPWMWIGRR